MSPVFLTAFSALMSVSFPGPAQGCGPEPLMKRLPLPINGTLIKGYGLVRHPLLQIVKLHRGIDYAGANRLVRAVAGGFVVFAGTLPEYGKTVIIAHGHGFETLYAHLDRVEVGAGLCVERGKEVGIEGNTGLSSGPHLHFEIRKDGTAVDPAPYF